ncbi:MAG: DEAD/DEAH box helicase, partial [Phycisphaerales bacterium]|nr:DEAD/DEAH box helicase [Phycisphaerales bacterium]
LLFTATFPPSVEAMAASYLRRPVRVEVDPSSTAAPHIRQWMVEIDERNKAPLVMALLAGLDRGGQARSGVVVFTRTRRRAGWIVAALARHGFVSEPIHGDRSHAQRIRALDHFASGRSPVLVATDVAARGLHIEAVRTVVNYDVPLQPEEYVHRIGRASHGVQSAGAGESFVLVDPGELSAWTAIERTIGMRPEELTVPDFSAYQAPWAAERAKEKPRRGKAASAGRKKAAASETTPDGAKSHSAGRRPDREQARPSRKSRPIGKQRPGQGVRRVNGGDRGSPGDLRRGGARSDEGGIR